MQKFRCDFKYLKSPTPHTEQNTTQTDEKCARENETTGAARDEEAALLHGKETLVDVTTSSEHSCQDTWGSHWQHAL